MLTACAAQGPQKTKPGDEQAVNALYADIERASARFDKAVELYEADDGEGAGANTAVRARIWWRWANAAWRSAAATCGA